MSRDNEKLSWPSLAQHFDAPEDYVGHFGWLCGYSADAAFLDDAVERFTRLTSTQRQRQGRVALAVLLDPGNPAISMLDAPAVAHLPIMDVAKKPFSLLHAKVALLGFMHQGNREQWQLRLIVSTGNWTRQTLEESLDLAWRVDISSDALNSKTLGNDVKQVCADIKAANDLLQWISELFDTRVLDASPNGGSSETKIAKKQINDWILSCAKKAKGQPRLFDNREKSLLAQLPAKIKFCGSEVARNYLAMGSGFYESARDQNRTPEVPKKIIETLKNEALLTQKPEVDLYINPSACQAIATSVGELNKLGVTVRPANKPFSVFGDNAPPILHAKFLFSANYRENSPLCNSAWVYLGSGNLTNPGFASKMSVSAGNFEAGVVFAPEGLLWEEAKNVDKRQVVTNLLPIQWDKIAEENAVLESGSDMEPREEQYIASPVAWLLWQQDGSASELQVPESDTPEFKVIDPMGNSCKETKTGFLWAGDQPRQVLVRWIVGNVQQEASIPVVDQYGRIAATELPQIGVDEAWWQLADFPLPPDDDGDTPDGDDENDGKGVETGSNGKSVQPPSYPIRQMMELVESIAAKQTEIYEMDWSLWCNRLEQTLNQAKESAAVKAFHALKLNPLSPLRHAPFRPLFAETAESQLGELYEETLVRIEKSWKVDQMKAVGDLL